MAQGRIDEDLKIVEGWYTEYMTQKDAAATRDPPDSESLDLVQASEAETLQLMREIDVTDGFCSTCHTMLDNWPDLEERGERLVAMNDGDNGPRIYPYSPSTTPNPATWVKLDYDVKYVLPCQG